MKIKLLSKDNLFIFFLSFILVVSTISGSIPVQTFSGIEPYFDITRKDMSSIYTLNFAGAAISSLISGVVLDFYGRKKTLIFCLIILVVSSINCLLTTNFFVFTISAFFM